MYDFDTSFTSTAVNDEESYSLKHHSLLIKNANTSVSLATSSPVNAPTNQTSASRAKKISKTTSKQQAINHFAANPSSTNSSFDPYYNSYSSSYVSPYPADVTAASFIEAATHNYTGNNSNDLLLVNESNPYSGTYSNYYAAALQQQYQSSLTPYHPVYYSDANNRYYTNHHRTSPSLNDQAYHQHQQQQQQQPSGQSHDNYLIDSTTGSNPYSYYLYNKTPSVSHHGHDSNNNLSLFDVSLSSPIHHSVIKHCTKR